MTAEKVASEAKKISVEVVAASLRVAESYGAADALITAGLGLLCLGIWIQARASSRRIPDWKKKEQCES